MIRPLFLAVLLALALPAPVWAADDKPATATEIGKAVEDAETAHDIQRDLPGFSGEEKVDRAPSIAPPKPEQQDGPSWLDDLARFFAPLFKLIGYLLLAALIAAILYGLYQMISGLRRPVAKDKLPDEPGSTELGLNEGAVQDWMARADALAAEGRYGDAVHSLLLSAIDDLKRRAARAIPLGWTAREVASDLPLNMSARQWLRLLVQATERARYAGRPVSAEDFSQCREGCLSLLKLASVREAA